MLVKSVALRVTPKLRVRNADVAIKFYTDVFGAKLEERCAAPDGTVVHAALKFGDTMFTLAEESTDSSSPGPLKLGGSPVSFDLMVPNVDDVVARAVAQGSKIQFPVKDQFYGLRQGRIADPFGHIWSVATPLDIAPEEIKRRVAEFEKTGREVV